MSPFERARAALDEAEPLAEAFGDATVFARTTLALRAIYDEALALNVVLAHRTAQLNRLTYKPGGSE